MIDPKTYKIIRHFRVGDVPHHITPSWNMHRLYVDNTGGDSLTVINPRTSRPTRKAARSRSLQPVLHSGWLQSHSGCRTVWSCRFPRPTFVATVEERPIPTSGPDHLDFPYDGRVLLISTEFSGHVYNEVQKMAVTGHVRVGGLPVDVKLSPDGSVFFVRTKG